MKNRYFFFRANIFNLVNNMEQIFDRNALFLTSKINVFIELFANYSFIYHLMKYI